MSDEKLPPLITTPPGLYRHYKGNLYEVLGTARHSETLEPMTLYRKLESDPNSDLWVRPMVMFEETVLVDGIQQPRFVKVSHQK
ncbi:MAG: hypothetical protein A3F78_15020 [Burkholderiales bacterium RIFCSPLOWO2_12_FULL_61_40]|nr:MAG: hypothetical protein A3F78_15020 [Burkholderiales bacterium RIFCSPLOWO2_12_FULL_61_40]